MANNYLGREVSIVGVGYTPMGSNLDSPELQNTSERELLAWAAKEALDNGNVNAQQVDAFLVGMSGPNYEARLKSGGPFFADWIGAHNKPTLFHDEGCGTSAIGITQAVMMVASGVYDCVISTAVNINSTTPVYALPPYIRCEQTSDEMWGTIWTGTDAAYSKPYVGGMAISDSSIICYCKQYGISFDEIDEAIVNYMIKKREEALLNPKAITVTETYEQEAKRFGFDSVKKYLLDNRYDPRMGFFVRARTLGKVVDGASAAVVCTAEIAKQLHNKPIHVAGIASACFPEKAFRDMPIEAEIKMFKQMYSMAGITDPRKELDYFGTHDCPVVTVIDTAEASGYMDPGEACRMMLEGKVNFDGSRPITTSGGRTQLGHPRAPAFNIELAEAVYQMRGENGARQMAIPPKTALVYGGGSGIACGGIVLKV